ncbi:MAG TPA: TlpA disulfide reductase family protein [Planctomycetota bacterium]|nr:TlpA disulfide reductase family protein [Planctomycetota bacterium]
MRAFLLLPLLALQSRPAREGDDLLGKPAPSLEGLRWIGRAPARIEDFRGKVVLVRWWTEGCVLCERSAPAIRELTERYGQKGLGLLAIFHPKPRPRAVDDEAVKKAAAALGFPLPLAVDPEWEVLRRWWLDGKREYTSVSFLLDREGNVRWIHPGGEFHRSGDADHAECAREFDALDAKVQEALAR